MANWSKVYGNPANLWKHKQIELEKASLFLINTNFFNSIKKYIP